MKGLTSLRKIFVTKQAFSVPTVQLTKDGVSDSSAQLLIFRGATCCQTIRTSIMLGAEVEPLVVTQPQNHWFLAKWLRNSLTALRRLAKHSTAGLVWNVVSGH
jgi:hypothetical protein